MIWGYVDLIHQELYALRSDYLMIIFGVTTGLLAMIGFVSFYIVNNAKQRLDQLMELTWTLKQAKHQSVQADQINHIVDKLYFYKKWMENRENDSVKFLNILKITLYFVLITWLATFFLLNSIVEVAGIGLFYFISGGIMIIFMRKVEGLQKTFENAKFPLVQDIVDGAQPTEIDGVYLAALLSKMYIQESYNNDDAITLHFGLPCLDPDSATELHFKNLKLYMPFVHFYTLSGMLGSISGNTSDLLREERSALRGSTLALQSGLDWYEIESNDPLRVPKACTSVEISFFLAPNENGNQLHSFTGRKGYWVTFQVDCKDIPYQRGVVVRPTSVQEGILTEYDLERYEERAKKENKEKHAIIHNDTLKRVSH